MGGILTGFTNPKYDALLAELLAFLEDEQRVAFARLYELWERPLPEKLRRGWTQDFERLEKGQDDQSLWAYLGSGESNFREGDLLALHSGDPISEILGRRLAFELEEDGRWLLRGDNAVAVLHGYSGGTCYADKDAIDLTAYYLRSLEEISKSEIGREIVLPLLCGNLPIEFDFPAVDQAERTARNLGLNARQSEAVGLAVGAHHVSWIQGPPGTGKTRVLALIARLLVDQGQRVLLTSHTHTAINHALNKICDEGVPVAKIGRYAQRRGLNSEVPNYPNMDAWFDCPSSGYVVGATPFSTCNPRLESYEFDVVLFDEASQVTVPLALMAMRKGRKYIFIGDQRQMPPVTLSRSILDKDTISIFAHLTSIDSEHGVMLEESYRMNQWLSDWPSRTFYHGKLISSGPNRERLLTLSSVPERLSEIFDPLSSMVFLPTGNREARTRNRTDAELIAELCEFAIAGGLPPEKIGIVSPYRAQGRLIRNLLAEVLGGERAREIVADTVERMQGQEREMIILSLATGDEVFLEAVAEFFFQPERLNVSVTRATTKLIVIGPEMPRVPFLVDEKLASWIDWYRDLISHCRKVLL